MSLRKVWLLCILFPYVVVANQSYIESFTATSNGKDIVIEFKTSNEQNVQTFEIERSVNKSGFKKITSIDAKGIPSNYRYVDTEAFMKDNQNSDNPTATNYTYRIKIIFKDNSFSYTNTVNVSHSVNGIYRSWGMIKAMFK